MNVIPIAFAFDNNLVMPACIAISSLLMNANKDTFYDIFILHSKNVNLDKTQLDKIPTLFKNCRIQYRQIGTLFDSAFEIRGITTAAYYRLMIPELIPEYDKILYSDVDVIFRSDLSDLYLNTEIEGYYVGGVNSMSDLQPNLIKYYKNLDIDAKSVIYSGNLLINSKQIISDGIIDKFKALVVNKYIYQDMDVLNIACYGKIKYLPLEFCLTTYASELKAHFPSQLLKYWSNSEIDTAFNHGIIHYNGQKPWKGICINFDIWWEYYRKSPFFNQEEYFNFFYDKLFEYDKLSLLKRIKILARYFFYKK